MTPNDVIQALTSGDLDSIEAAIKPELRELVPVSALAQLWSEATEHLGAFVETGEQVVMQDQTLVFEQGVAHLQVVYIGDQITGITMAPGHPSARYGE
ncbi:MAG: hypothetical protein QOG43_1202 [Actinomycetota bacterium]|jgi:hypothetical protein|nr:hypothetical protein [Actinomycetota bacterium]